MYLSKVDLINSTRGQLYILASGIFTEDLCVHGIAFGLDVQVDRQRLLLDVDLYIEVNYLLFMRGEGDVDWNPELREGG